MLDWKIVALGLQFILTLFTAFGILVIKLNDIKHISKYVEEIKKTDKSILKSIVKIEKDIIKRSVICEERHPKK